MPGFAECAVKPQEGKAAPDAEGGDLALASRSFPSPDWAESADGTFLRRPDRPCCLGGSDCALPVIALRLALRGLFACGDHFGQIVRPKQTRTGRCNGDAQYR